MSDNMPIDSLPIHALKMLLLHIPKTHIVAAFAEKGVSVSMQDVNAWENGTSYPDKNICGILIRSGHDILSQMKK